MPRFAVPVTFIVGARDAERARQKIECSSITGLDVPGLLSIRFADAVPVASRRHAAVSHRAALRALCEKLGAAVSSWKSDSEVSTHQLLALADLLQDATTVLRTLILTTVQTD